MKICLEGAMSTGKTTIGKLVAERMDFPFIDEVARKALDVGYKLDQSADFETQFWILAKQFEQELSRYDFVADRGVLSVAVYSYLNKNMSVQQKQILYKVIKGELLGSGVVEKRYDLIFYFPIGRIELKDDGVRCVDQKFQMELDRIFLTFLKNWNIPYHEVKSLQIEDRVEEIVDVIHKHFNI